MSRKRKLAPDRLRDTLSIRISSEIRTRLEKKADFEQISLCEAARQAIDEGLKIGARK
jgi:hypothetical protein